MHYEATFLYDEGFHRAVYRQYLRDHPVMLWWRRFWAVFLPFMAVLLALFAALLQAGGDRSYRVLWTCSGIFVLYTVFFFWFKRYRSKSAVPKGRPGAMQYVEQTVVLSDERVVSDLKQFGRSEMAWISFNRVTHSDKFLLLYMSKADYLAFPRGLMDGSAWATLCSQVQEKVRR